MKHCLPLILLGFLVFTPGFAWAEQGLLESLTTLNRIQPLQHPDYDKSAEILGRRVLGQGNKVLGEVDDVILNKNGNIASLQVEFDRLGLRQPVFINYNALNAEPVTNGYLLGFESAEMEKLYPSLLANVETASGTEDETYALTKLNGIEVRTPAGQKIGTITDVLFGANGDRAEVFYMVLSGGKARGKGVGLPYDLPQIKNTGGRLQASVTKEQADIITAFVEERK